MTSRIGQPDTAADVELRELLDSNGLPAFTMIAGAGSGKTTSLVKALAHVVSSRGTELRRRTQKVACITYTEVAAQEIFADVGSDPLAMVATVHSFLWSVVSPFQRDIKRWAREQAGSRLAEREAKQRSFGSRVGNIQQIKVESDIEKLRHQIAKLDSVDRFRYGLGTDFGRGVIGHEDVLKVATRLLLDRPLLATLLSQRYPFVFIDESQDTFVEVVEALKRVRAIVGSRFCLGFFGDPMQKVYPRGVGVIHSDPDWAEIKKPENFRSPQRVLNLMNDIRSPVDGLRQVSGLSTEKLSDGKVFFFVVPADDSRTQSLRKVRQYLDTATSRYEWTTDNPAIGCKILVIAHRMAARRLGFEEFYSAFHDSGSSSLSQSFDDGTAWPVKFFCDSVLPLVRSTGDEQLAILRQRSPLLRRARSGALLVGDTLSILRADLEELVAMVNAGGPGSVRKVLELVSAGNLVEIDPRFAAFLGGVGSSTDVVVSDSILNALENFARCNVHEVENYARYAAEQSPYITHQGVKGAEFARVLVVLDDEEGRHNQFSYDKFFGIRDPSATDRENERSGKESVFDRTRRLLYVCVSRSTEALALVIYSHDVSRAAEALRASGLPGASAVLTSKDLWEG